MSKNETSVFRNRSYVLLIFSNIFNRFGDSIDAIVFTWLTYDLTGSASFSAIVFAANRFPTVILQPVAGVLIERKRKKYIMAAADVMRASLAGYILVRLITGVLAPAEMITVTFLISTVESFRQPAGYSILPSIIDKSMYSKAVSYQSGISSAAELAGMGAAGVLIGFIGNAGAVAVDVAMFALSALFLIFMKTGERRSSSENKMSYVRFVSDLKEGVYGIKQSRVLSYLLILVIILNALLTPFNALQAAMVSEILHSDETMLSVSGAAVSIGMITGAAVYPTVSKYMTKRHMLIVGTVMCSMMYLGNIFIGAFFTGSAGLYPAEAVLMMTTGAAIAVVNTFSNVEILNTCRQEMLSRVNGLVGSACSLATPLTSAAVSLLISGIPIDVFFIVCGILVFITGMVMFSRRLMPEEYMEKGESNVR